jgi:FkbM family methyltransferase
MRLKNERFFLWINRLFWPLFFLRHQGKRTVVVKEENGARFRVRVNTSDFLMVWEIWRAKAYDDARIPIRAGDTVVDLGAHIGSFAVRAARQAHHGRVFAYEASSKNYAMLGENRQLNRLDNLYIENSAVSDRHGSMTLYSPADNGMLSSLMHESGSFMETVQATTFTEIIQERGIERIDVLKMDVEGAEYDILLNCPDESLMKVQRIVMEYHEFDADKRNHRDLVSRLNLNGFTVVVEKGVSSLMDWFGALFGGRIISTGIIKAWRE